MLKGASWMIIAFVSISKGQPTEYGIETIWGGESVAKYMQKFEKFTQQAWESPTTKSKKSPETYNSSNLDYEVKQFDDTRRYLKRGFPNNCNWEDKLSDDPKTWGWPWNDNLEDWLKEQEDMFQENRRSFKNDLFFEKSYPIEKFQIVKMSEWKEPTEYSKKSSTKDWGWPFKDDGTLRTLRELARNLRRKNKIKRIRHIRHQVFKRPKSSHLFPISRMKSNNLKMN